MIPINFALVNCQQAQFTHDHNIHGSRYIYIYREREREKGGGGDVRMQTHANDRQSMR